MKTAPRLNTLSAIVVLSFLAAACGPEDEQILQLGSALKGNCAVTLSGNPAPGSISAGTSVALTATGSCNSGTPEYHISMRNPVGAWTTLKAWGTANTVSWDTAGLAVGAHRLLVKIRAVNSGDTWEGYDYSRTYTLSSNGGPCTAATMSSSPTSPQAAGTSVTLTGMATCPAGTTAEYRFVTRGPDMVWRQAQGWGTTLTYSWDTTSVQDGRHTFYFYARDQGTATPYDTFAGPLHYDITASTDTCTQATIAASPESPQAAGAQVTLTAASTCTNGATAHYRFVAYKPDNTYVQLRGWASATTHVWDTTGQDTGTWQLQVYSRRQGSTSPAEGISSKLAFTLTTSVDTRVYASLTSTGGSPNGDSHLNYTVHRASATTMVSSDGRYSVFRSMGTNLVPTSSMYGILYLRDHQAGTTEVVSIGTTGTFPVISYVMTPTVSDNGRYVAFWSNDGSLVPGGYTQRHEILLRDRQTNTTTWVSEPRGGLPISTATTSTRPAMASDGQYLVFQSDGQILPTVPAGGRIFRYNIATGALELASALANGTYRSGRDPSVSADGRYVSFSSSSTDLVSGDTNGGVDVFVKDMTTGTLTRASVSSTGQQTILTPTDPAISADGRYVTFLSRDATLWGGTGTTQDMAVVHDLQTGQTSLVSQTAAGVSANDAVIHVSRVAGGRVAFATPATNLDSSFTPSSTSVYIKDLSTGTVTAVGPANAQPKGWYKEPTFSKTGKYLLLTTNCNRFVTPPESDGYPDVVRLTVF